MPFFIDLSYSAFEGKSLGQAISRAAPSFQYIKFLKPFGNTLVILHTREKERFRTGDAVYQSFMSETGGFFWIPYDTNKYVASLEPDVILIQGLMFPFQLLLLRYRLVHSLGHRLGKKPVIVVQHHGEQPERNIIKRLFQRWADKYTDGYFFTSPANADVWIKAGIISNKAKCFEVLEASTDITAKDKLASKLKLGITGDRNFLWVGRLNTNKDPLTVLKAFERYVTTHPDARLYMIYQSEELLGAIKQKLTSGNLSNTVVLVGQVAHDELAEWYSAADFYISASHREGSGYALLEAMACGCVPIVTDIPSFRTMTGDGRYAFLYKPGDVNDLLRVLQGLPSDTRIFSGEVMQHFNDKLTAKAIGESIYAAFKQLLQAKN